MTVSKPLIDSAGEVRELDDHFFENAKRGRPPLPQNERKKRVNLMLDPDVIARLREDGDMSARVNKLLRKDLGL